MNLTRFVRGQLLVFSVLTVIGLIVMSVVYVGVPAMLGFGRYSVTVELAATGGLYPHANVAYRGTNIGKVEEVRLTPDGVDAKLSLDSSYDIPVDVEAWVKSVSAVGEQYVDLIPRSSGGPYLSQGDVIPEQDTKLPQDVGPMLDQADRLLQSVADTRLQELVDSAFVAFNGTGPDLQRLLDSATLLVQEANANVDQTKILIDQIGPLLDTQIDSSDAVRSWTADLVRFTDQLRISDPQLRSLMENGPSAAADANRLFQELQPTLPLLLSNLVSVGQVGVTYNAGIEQILVIYPPLIAALTTALRGDPRNGAMADFHLSVGDPPACTTGFLPPSAWRSPADFSVPDTPPNLFCKTPQDSKFVVRGARNTPCMEFPGKRAGTVEECRSPEGFVPEGTNPPIQKPPAPAATPSSYTGPKATDQPAADQPRTGARQYDPTSGTYVGPDGRTYSQPNLVSGSPNAASDWQTLMTEQQG